MGKQGAIRICIVGRVRRQRLLLETLTRIAGVAITGLVDPAPSPEGLELARRFGLPVYRGHADYSGWDGVDVIIFGELGLDSRVFDPAALPQGAALIRGSGAALIRRLAVSYARQLQEAGRYRGMKRSRNERARGVEDFIGRSEHIREIKELIRVVAPTPTPVLLLGETGTGKDLAARAIHDESLVKTQPFVAVNCTALTGTLMESELFGYKKGAFTGADEDRAGLMEEADGGTLFLDEIGDMPLELQAKLLRFLQTGEVRRVGATKTRIVNVRVIAATNRDLSDMAETGQFRRDLFYRFNTFTITLKPLRERREDIPYLAYHMLTKAEAKLNKKIAEIGEAALARLCAYGWPGNVRELSNIIERAVILCRRGVIEEAELPEQVAGEPAPPGPAHPGRARGNEEALDNNGFSDGRERIVANFERTELLVYLKKAGGNVSEACRLSGVPRRTFYRKMKKYGL